MQIHGGVVGVGRLVNVGAVVLDVAPVVDVPRLVVDVVDAPDPVPRLLGALGVGVVLGVAGEAGAEVEEASVGDGWSW